MIEPYNAVGLIPSPYGTHRRAGIADNRRRNGSTFAGGVINIEALRRHRESAQVTNWLKDVRAELAQIIYERPIYPINLYLDKIPGKHAACKREVIDKQIASMRKRGIWEKPAHSPR